MNKKDINTAHLGSRKLEIDNVKLMIPYIENIKQYVNDFRYNAKKSYTDYQHLKDLYYEKYDNFISILGDRGLGKTSIMLTIINEIKNGRYFSDDEPQKNYCIDLISPLLVPDDMSENSDILGWIIVSLENIFENQLKVYNKTSCLLNRDSKIIALENNITDSFHNLKRNYHHRKDDYKSIVNKTYHSDIEYINEATLIQQQDLEIVNSFNHLIDSMIEYKKHINKSFEYSDEPLIFFFFDDVDVTAQYCESIFETFLTFLSNAHIVTFISGDYDLFLQSVTIKLLEKEKIYHYGMDRIYLFGKTEKQYQAIELIKKRAEYFLKKILPPMYRFEIRWLDNQKKSLLKYKKNEPNKNDDTEILLQKSIKELLESICILLIKNNKDDNSNNSFFLEYKNTAADKYIDILPYYSVFSRSVRGFMNVYLYLVGEIKTLENMSVISNKHKLKFMEEFLQIILNSKNTYRKNLNNIAKYIYIKKGKNVNENSPEYTRLRIDCEELKVIIKNKINENYKENTHYLSDDCKDEIQSLFMLPLFMNELQNILFDGYKYRYKRIRDKIKNIILFEFVNKFNSRISMFLPENIGFEETLLLYSFITTRMSMEAISTMNGDLTQPAVNTEKYNENNDKKYLVQIMKAVYAMYDKQETDYHNILFGEQKERFSKEKELFSKLISKCKNVTENNTEPNDDTKPSNYKWLLYLGQLIKNNLSVVSHLYPYQNFFNEIELTTNKLSNLLNSDDNIQKNGINELNDILRFCENLKFVFNDDNLINYLIKGTKYINDDYNSIIETFINKIKSIPYNKNNTYLKNKDYNNYINKKFNIINFDDYDFDEKRKVYVEFLSNKANRNNFEKVFLYTKKIFDALDLELDFTLTEFSEIDTDEFFNTLYYNTTLMLAINYNNYGFEKYLYNEIKQISYGKSVDKYLSDKIKNFLSELSIDKRIIDRVCQYIKTELDNLAHTVSMSNKVDRKKTLFLAQIYIYIIPIYIVSTYFYDLNCTDSYEKKFFLNLLSVINKELDYE